MRRVDRNEMPMARCQLSGDKEKGPAFLQAFQFAVSRVAWIWKLVAVATAPSAAQHKAATSQTHQKLMPKISRASKIWCSVRLSRPSLGLPEICGNSVNVAHHLDVP